LRSSWLCYFRRCDRAKRISPARPCGAVLNTLELLHDPDLHARGMMQKIDHPVRGPVTVPGWPLRMSDSKVALKCAPIHGADTEAIYGEWLGCSVAEVKDMRQRKVI
jgi:formyl-CoA transferase